MCTIQEVDDAITQRVSMDVLFGFVGPVPGHVTQWAATQVMYVRNATVLSEDKTGCYIKKMYDKVKRLVGLINEMLVFANRADEKITVPEYEALILPDATSIELARMYAIETIIALVDSEISNLNEEGEGGETAVNLEGEVMENRVEALGGKVAQAVDEVAAAAIKIKETCLRTELASGLLWM